MNILTFPTEDKSEGVKQNSVPRGPDPTPLPTDERFILWVDDEGDYMIQLESKPGLLAHGATLEDAVWVMREVLDLARKVGAR
jgi:hypothetical protein